MKTANIEVTLIDHMGSDLSVVNAARVSFSKESEWEYDTKQVMDEDEFGKWLGSSTEKIIHSSKRLSKQDKKLINYLAKHKHHSPFNHAFLSFRVKAPIFVARQLVKHKFMPWNEISRRYVDDEPEFYFPEYWRGKAENVKQGSSDEVVDIVTKCHENPYYVKFHNMKARAKREGIPFDLTLDKMVWPSTCSVLGIPLVYDLGRGKIMDDSPSIDRIDPTKGYTEDNIRIISNKANTMKSSATKDELVKFAEEVLLTHKGYVPDYTNSPEGVCEKALDVYEYLLSIGTCAEQARMVLPQNTMTEWYWSGTLGAFLDMLVLRLDNHTQKETRDVANLIAKHIQCVFPVSYEAYLGTKGETS